MVFIALMFGVSIGILMAWVLFYFSLVTGNGVGRFLPGAPSP